MNSTPPRLTIWNNRFHVLGETAVQTKSQVAFTFNVLRHDSDQPFQPPDLEEGDSEDDMDDDMDTLYARTPHTTSHTLSTLNSKETTRVHSEVHYFLVEVEADFV